MKSLTCIAIFAYAGCDLNRGSAAGDSDDSNVPDTEAIEDSLPPDTDLPDDTSAESPCDLVVLPQAAITVDGDASDWASIVPVVSDPINDNLLDYSGGDLAALYLAYDDTWLYIRIEVTEPPSTSFNNGPAPNDGRYHIFLDPFAAAGLAYTEEGWSLGGGGTGGEGLSLLGPSAVGVQGTSIEIKVLLTDIQTTDGWFSTRISMENCCADPWSTVDEFECRSIAWPPADSPS